MFPIATFYFGHFLFYVTVIMVVRTNTKYTRHVKCLE